MKCEFTETQFLFSFTSEILKTYANKLKMPWFPNTVQEGREGGGFDVKIEFDNFNVTGSLFFQFKIPTYLKRANKYRIAVNTNENQFFLLKKLRDKGPANLVYYASPKFYTAKQLKDFYSTNVIEENSALFLINHFPNDGNYHKLVYEYYDIDNRPYGILHSKPSNIDISANIFSSHYTPYKMTLSEKAKYIFSLIWEIDANLEKENWSHIIRQVFSILLIRYNILWIPIINDVC